MSAENFDTLDREYAARVGCEPLGPPPGPEPKIRRMSAAAKRRAEWCADTAAKRAKRAEPFLASKDPATRAFGVKVAQSWPAPADLPDFIRHGE